jgi:glycerophosphoryl diester phosphodiesterase
MIRKSLGLISTTIVSASLLLAVESSAQAAACPAPIPAVAHRGGVDRYDENTRKAFQYSSSIGANIWETDVRFDSAGTPFLMHDETIDRTTTGAGAVAGQDLSAARAAGVRTDDGQVIPTLYEFLSDASRLGARVLLEIKADPSPAELSKVLARLDWTSMRSRVVVMSFDAAIIAKVQQAAPDIETGLVEDPSYRPVSELTALGIGSYIKHYYSITASRLDEWSGPLDVYTWTVDRGDEWARMQWYASEPGRLDGVITDYPAGYLAWARARTC